MRRKKNKNKKIDIYTALMLPLMTMFLLNIGLIATTWAWYTASISTGVNEIRAASTWSTANISSQSANTYKLSTAVGFEPIEVSLTDGELVSLTGGNAYIFSITNEGNSHSGYYCLLTFETNGGEVEEIYTENFGNQTTGSNDVTFIVCLYDDATVSLQTFWGNPPEDKQTVEEVVELFVPDSDVSSEETEIDEDKEVDENEELQQIIDSNESEKGEQQTSSSAGAEIPAETPTSRENTENAEEHTEMQASEESPFESVQSTENLTSETETTSTPATEELSEVQSDAEVDGEEREEQIEIKTEE